MNRASIRIERAGLEDLEGLAPLFDDYRSFYGRPGEKNISRAFLEERLRLNESVVFAAVRDREEGGKEALGFAQLYPSFSSVSAQRLWILNDLFVAGHERGQGIGRMLLEAARGFAAESGAKGLTLTTGTGNTGAQRLYESCGYVRDDDFYTYNLTVAGK